MTDRWLKEQQRLAGISEENSSPQKSADRISSAVSSLFKGHHFDIEVGRGLRVCVARMHPEEYAKQQVRTKYALSPNNRVCVSILPGSSLSSGWVGDLKAINASDPDDIEIQRNVGIVFRKKSGLTPEKAEDLVIKWFKANAKRILSGKEMPEMVLGSSLSVVGLRDALRHADVSASCEELRISANQMMWSLRHFRGILKEREELTGEALGDRGRKVLLAKAELLAKRLEESKTLLDAVCEGEEKLIRFVKTKKEVA